MEQCLRKSTKWQGIVLERIAEQLNAATEHTPSSFPSRSYSAQSSTALEVQSEVGDDLPLTQDILDLEIPVTQSSTNKDEEDLLAEALNTAPVPARKENLRVVAAEKKPAAAISSKIMKKPVSKSIAKGTTASTNFVFQSVSFGKCKAEFYSYKSYIRKFSEETNKWTLVIQVEGDGHAAKLATLVSHAKKVGSSKDKLLAIRAKL